MSRLGDVSIARFLFDAGAVVDAIDSAASRTTPLIEAARAGHRDVCTLLLQRGADAMHCDAHGDTAFHWAARREHGSLLVDMALAIDKLEGRGASDVVWKSKVRANERLSCRACTRTRHNGCRTHDCVCLSVL